jgi:hypothetical protein
MRRKTRVQPTPMPAAAPVEREVVVLCGGTDGLPAGADAAPELDDADDVLLLVADFNEDDLEFVTVVLRIEFPDPVKLEV